MHVQECVCAGTYVRRECEDGGNVDAVLDWRVAAAAGGGGRRTEGRGRRTRSGVRTGGAARGPAEPAGRRDGEARGAAHRREEKNDGAEGRGGLAVIRICKN